LPKMSAIRKVLDELSEESSIAREWSNNDIAVKQIAISYDEVCEDTGTRLNLGGFVAHCIETEILSRKIEEELG